MKIVCISPEGPLYQGDITKVTLPTADGTATILPGHYHMITTMRKGTIDIRPVVTTHTSQLQDFQDGKISFPVQHGFCLVGDDTIHLSVE